MAIAAALGASQGWSDRVDDWLPIVDEMFVAANSIPEGPPVDTIARRPDGKYLATRILTVSDGTPAWNYKNLTWPEVEWEYLRQNDADSWPVIYDPREYEGTEYDPETGLHWFKPGEEPLVPRPDPTAQQEPGESLARGLDDLAAGRVSRRDDYLEPEDPEYCGNCDGRKCMGCVFREYDHDCADDCPDCCTTARTPRVVDRLGVDEQGSRWQDRQLGEWKFDGQAWRYLELTWTSVPGGEWVEAEPSKRYGPYVEVPS
ncbi:hypothetical protein [Mycobacteroides abscessus]|uniref:hypothetical protein n=1 Tax=Mycobacteroides abscessus TaxID=36809 RepID=UPI0009CE9035|nr:hypothetical protein [Mycobacteroides abscessus]SLH07111.1 Uncharacterised protein [Mycobacteroides abscessus subsp. abscessus]